jgi:hypothetical protein
VDKIDQFAAEFGNPATNAPEQLLALKFLLHFVGDVHQPLHAADDHDAGGNKKLVTLTWSKLCGMSRFTLVELGSGLRSL